MNNASFKDNKLKTRKVVHAQRRFEIEKENIEHYHQEKKKILKDTKNLLTISFMSIIFCLIALTGTTYAWFTSTISNTNNRIQAGTLDVAFLAQIDGSDQIVDLSSDVATVFNVKSLKPENPVQAILTVKNKGTVNLKFTLFFNITKDDNPVGNEDAKLSKMLNVYVREYNEKDTNPPKESDLKGTMASVSGTSGFISEELTAGMEKKYRVWLGLNSSAGLATYTGQSIEFDICLRAQQDEYVTIQSDNN